MTRREYRIQKLIHGDDHLSFEVEYRVNAHSAWLKICDRHTLHLAKEAIAVIRGQEVISKEVVWND